MTSLQTQYSQKLTKRWISTRGIFYYTYAEMKSVFDVYSPTYSGTSSVLFNTESDLANAVADLDDYANNNGNSTDSTNGPTILNDIGKDVRLGVKGRDSSMYTYRLLEIVNDPSGDMIAGLLVYVMIDQNPSINVINLVREAYNATYQYGQIWVTRGY